MATIRRVAREAAVSTATVSRVLNNTASVSPDLRERVLGVADRLNYSVAKGANPEFVALVYTGRISIGSSFDTAVLMGATAAAEEAGLSLVIMRLAADRKPGESALQLLHRKGIRGAVLRTHHETRDICSDLARSGFPSIVVGDSFDDDCTSSICADSESTSHQAVEHLISAGHRRIAIAISHVPDHDHAARLAGYERALADHHIAVDPKLVHRVWAMRPNGEQVMKTLLSLPNRPTAVFVTDPMVAVGAINYAHEVGVRIPEDVSILGFDDTDTRNHVYPKMSAICQDARQLGYEAMSALTRSLLAKPGVPIRKVLPTWLEFHRTTGQAPVGAVRFMPDGSRMENAGVSTEFSKEVAAIAGT